MAVGGCCLRHRYAGWRRRTIRTTRVGHGIAFEVLEMWVVGAWVQWALVAG